VIDVEELELFANSVRQATERRSGDALDAALAELGWTDALAADPYNAIAIVFAAQGAANATSSALDQVVAFGLGSPATTAGVVLPPLGQWLPPSGGGDVHGVGTGSLAHTEYAVVATAHNAVATVPTSALTLRTVEGVDPAFGLVAVHGDAAATSAGTTSEGNWSDAVVLAQLALGHELVGAARTMLALAREHALDRVQFGKPIAQFQAVRHRLAETLVAIEGADALLRATSETPSAELAAMAKSVAGRSARTAARHCQQVLAGIGFTTEHDFHRYFRRVLLLDQLFGSSHALTAHVGAQLLRTRQLPGLLPL
jgi:acyl-CoA dehydrogenase-like protein